MDEQSRQPLLQVVRGNPDSAELAALTVVVAGLAASASEADRDESRPASRWVDRAALMRRPLQPGPGAWQASALPC